MTIKEIEERSGMTRANIRFYESEGLLKPERKPNGYRDYSEEDLDTLQKIRLLRLLHFSLDDIKAMDRNEKTLSQILSGHIDQLRENEQELARCRYICSRLRADGAQFKTLEPVHYLEFLNTSSASVPQGIKEDTVQKVTAPWKRYFARTLDLCILSLAWNAVLALGFHMNIHAFNIGLILSQWIMPLILLIITEPILLAFFGTTPGKFIWGLGITNEDGGRLTIHDARQRTWIVLKNGMGLNFPIVCLFRQYISYKECVSQHVLPWEDGSVLILRNKKSPKNAAASQAADLWARIAAPGSYIAARILLLALAFLTWQAGALPVNRGELSAAQFCENYNQLQAFYQVSRPVNVPDTPIYNYIGAPMTLNDEGQWENRPGFSQSFAGNFSQLPQLEFLEAPGSITGISFSLAYEKEDVTVVSYSDFTYTAAGVTVTCRIRYSGYEQAEGSAMLIPQYGQEPVYHMTFTIARQDTAM